MTQRLRRSFLALARRWPPRNGPVTLLFAVFRPYVFPPLLLALFFLLRRYVRDIRALLLAGAVLTLARRVQSRQYVMSTKHDGFGVISWNMLFSNPRADEMVQFLATAPAPIVALQELTAAHVEQIGGDTMLARRYPHQVLWTHGYGAGMALLSQYPITEHGKLATPPTLWARLCMDEGRQLVLVSTHPTFFPPRPEGDAPKPPRTPRQRLRALFDPRFLRYRTAHRDEGIRRVRVLVEQFLAEDVPLLLVGDFNVTEREQAYRDLADRLIDVHRAVGTGDGHTWRPEWLARWPFALLRIDYMWCNAALLPLRMWVDRTPRGSDHSLIHGVFALVGTNSASPTFSTQIIQDT